MKDEKDWQKIWIKRGERVNKLYWKRAHEKGFFLHIKRWLPEFSKGDRRIMKRKKGIFLCFVFVVFFLKLFICSGYPQMLEIYQRMDSDKTPSLYGETIDSRFETQKPDLLAIPSYNTGKAPSDISSYHLPNSDLPALIVSNYNSMTVNIYVKSEGGYEIHKEILVSGHPIAVTTGDFNHDFIKDIATANYKENTISVFLGDEQGNHHERVYNTGRRPIDISSEDMDGNGFKDDLCVLSYDDNCIYIYYNSGQFRKEISTGTAPSSLKVYDINRDGLKDVITTNSKENTVFVFLQMSNGEFVLSNTLQTGSVPEDVILDDFNKDGIIDIALANLLGEENNKGSIYIFEGLHNGSFIQKQKLYMGIYFPLRLVSGDFNGDSYPDLAIGNIGWMSDARKGNWVSIYKGGKANGREEWGFSYAYQLTAGINPVALIAEDITNDNILDLLAVNVSSNNFVVYQGSIDGTFGPQNNYPAGNGAHWIESGDFNRDGNADLVTANLDSTDISVLFGNGDGSFEVPVLYDIGVTVHAVTPGDLNNDGILDLVTANIGSNTISILYGDEEGNFSIGATYVVGLRPHLVRINDLNQDGINDLVIPIMGSNYAAILIGNGSGGFQYKAPLFSGYHPNDAAISDFNEDGIKDIIISHFWENYITVFTGIGDGSFVKKENINVGGNQHSVLIKDVNVDGKKDVIGTLFDSNGLFTMFGLGDGSFRDLTIYNIRKLPSIVALEDFNGDGVNDISVVCELDNVISILLGSTDGSFSFGADFIAGRRPAALVLDDFNNDSEFDIAVSNWYTDDVTIMLQNVSGET